MASTTRLRLRVSPGAAGTTVVGRHGKIVEPAGIGPDEIEGQLATAGGQETG